MNIINTILESIGPVGVAFAMLVIFLIPVICKMQAIASYGARRLMNSENPKHWDLAIKLNEMIAAL